MKFNKSSQLLLVSAASLLVAGLITACGTLTVDFVFVASSKAAGPNNYGEIDVFEINSESGYMRQIPTSPFPSGGRDPVAEAVSSDNTNLYVVNQDDNTIVQFVIGNDGKLYPQNTVNTPGIFPLAVAVNGIESVRRGHLPAAAHLLHRAPCSGSIAVFPIHRWLRLTAPCRRRLPGIAGRPHQHQRRPTGRSSCPAGYQRCDEPTGITICPPATISTSRPHTMPELQAPTISSDSPSAQVVRSSPQRWRSRNRWLTLPWRLHLGTSTASPIS